MNFNIFIFLLDVKKLIITNYYKYSNDVVICFNKLTLLILINNWMGDQLDTQDAVGKSHQSG